VAGDVPWQVRIALDPAEVDAISVAMHVVSLVPWELRLPRIEDEGSPVLSIEIRTEKQEDAEKQASELYARARQQAQRQQAQLSSRWAQVLGALAPIFPRSPHEDLLDEAKGHIERKDWELAVVRAQTACEVYARRALDRLARDVAEHDQKKKPSSLFRSMSLRARSDRTLLRALTGQQIADEKWWASYNAHVERRNEVVHSGITVTEREARESMGATEAFIAFLKARWEGASSA
jgi:hypothetical protein